MTHELQEQLRIMAEFDGYTVYNKRYPRNHGIGAPEAEYRDCILEKLKYHRSYDVLMPVWFKFRDAPGAISHEGWEKHREFRFGIANIIAFAPISEAFTALYNAITWYNTIQK